MQSTGEQLKVVVVGPRQAGKTILVNFLAEHADFSGEYRPTKGVRVQELDKMEVYDGGEAMAVSVNLWDCSGDDKYRDCWPAMRLGSQAVVIVANPERHDGASILAWYDNFVEKEDIPKSNVLVLLIVQGEKNTADAAISDFRLPSKVQGSRLYASSIEHDADLLREEFNAFIAGLQLMPREEL